MHLSRDKSGLPSQWPGRTLPVVGWGQRSKVSGVAGRDGRLDMAPVGASGLEDNEEWLCK